MSINGPITAPRFEPVGELYGTGSLGEALGDGVINRPHQDTVGADAGLAGVAYFEAIAPFDRHLMSASSKKMNGAWRPFPARPS
jgi:hypothetical protein